MRHVYLLLAMVLVTSGSLAAGITASALEDDAAVNGIAVLTLAIAFGWLLISSFLIGAASRLNAWIYCLVPIASVVTFVSLLVSGERTDNRFRDDLIAILGVAAVAAMIMVPVAVIGDVLVRSRPSEG